MDNSNNTQDNDNVEGNPEEDGNSTSAIVNDEYVPCRPNILEMIRSAAPPGYTIQQHGEREIITGPDGRHFIARFYEHASTANNSNDQEATTTADSDNNENNEEESHETLHDSNPEINDQNSGSRTGVILEINGEQTNLLENPPIVDEDPEDEDDEDGNMARTLCVNLLSELVKGSYQLFQTRGRHLEGLAKQEAINKLNVIKRKCDDMKDSLSNETGDVASTSTPSSSTSSNVPVNTDSAQKRPNIAATSDVSSASSEQTRENLGGTEVLVEKIDHEDMDRDTNPQRKRKINQDDSESVSDTNFKKAKYSWQIKGAGHQSKEAEKEDSMATPGASSYSGEKKKSANAAENCPKTGTESGVVKETKSCTSSSVNSGDGRPRESSNSSENTNSVNTCRVHGRLGRNGQPSFTYLERWQNHHIAKAIVDNAINKTLDEMNLGPQDQNNQIQATGGTFSRQRQRIEDAGVSQVILQRGLRRPDTPPNANSQSMLPNTGTINPFINHLTEMTENMFVENFGTGVRLSAHIDLGNNLQFRNASDLLQSVRNRTNNSSESTNSTNIRLNVRNVENHENPVERLESSERNHSGQKFSSTFENATPLRNFCANRSEGKESNGETTMTGTSSGHVSEASRTLDRSSVMPTTCTQENDSCESGRDTSNATENKNTENSEEQNKSVSNTDNSHQNSDSNSGEDTVTAIKSSGDVIDKSNGSLITDTNCETITGIGIVSDTKKTSSTDEIINTDNSLVDDQANTALDVIEELEKNAPSQNYVLDTAVNAVICEKGLQF